MLKEIYQFAGTKNEKGILQSSPILYSTLTLRMKKLLAEAGTQTRDCWVITKQNNFCTENLFIQNELCGLTKTSHCNSQTLFIKASTEND